MTARNIGYIVYDEITGNVVSLLKRDNCIWKHIPREGVLLSDCREATVFPSRLEALKAIMRTITWGRQHGKTHKWESSNYTLVRLVPNATAFIGEK